MNIVVASISKIMNPIQQKISSQVQIHKHSMKLADCQDNKTTDATDYKRVGLVFCEHPPKIAPFLAVFSLLAKPPDNFKYHKLHQKVALLIF